jgi:hypothetical protein
MPTCPQHYSTQSGAVKIMMNTHVMTYLFSDGWTVGAKLVASPKIRAEAERRRPQELLDVFLDLVSNVKRFEIVSNVRDRPSHAGGGHRGSGSRGSGSTSSASPPRS